MNATQLVVDALQSAAFGPAATFENLTVVPLLAPEEREADYLTLDEALAAGWVRIEEAGQDGRVPELVALNRGARPALLVDGEELVGAKQNRVLNLTVLVPANSKTTIPVSCVEQGRWHHVSRQFASAPRVQFAEGRAAKMRDVTDSLRHDGSRRSDQGSVWSVIASKSERLDAYSETSAMSDLFEAKGKSVDEYVSALPSVERQAGAVFVVNGRPAGVELFDSPATWRKLAPKLLRSYALDAIDRRALLADAPAGGDERAFLSAVTMSAANVFPGVGEGEDVRLTGPSLVGAALVARGRAVHVSALAM